MAKKNLGELNMEMMQYKLGDLCRIASAKRIFENEYVASGIPFVRGQEISDGSLLDPNAVFDCHISKERYEEIKQKYGKPGKGDILITAVGTIGNLCYLDKDIDFYFKDGNVIWFSDIKDFCCGQYLFHFMKGSFFKDQLKYYMIGAVQKALTMDMLKKVNVPLPSLPEQKKIAAVLSALDDKIALNKKMNQKLEAMAKRLYDYWFVQFDFPDENGRPYKTSGGPMTHNPTLNREIPEGWEVKQISEVAKIFNGSTPSTTNEYHYGGDIVWITPKDLSDQNSKFIYQGARNITQAGYDSCSTTMVPKGTVVMSSRAPIGLLSIAQCNLCTNQGFKNMVPCDMTDSKYLYYTIQQHIPQIQNLGTGTTFKEVSKDELGRFAILYPPKKLIATFEERMAPIFNAQFNKVKEISRLTALRDKLIPLLMNGQVMVRQVHII